MWHINLKGKMSRVSNKVFAQGAFSRGQKIIFDVVTRESVRICDGMPSKARSSCTYKIYANFQVKLFVNLFQKYYTSTFSSGLNIICSL